jgi:agmatine deiminase
MWEAHFEQAKADYAEIANAIAAFEPVSMAASPAQVGEARAACGAGVDVVAIPLDDSWVRDSGPIFVTGSGTRRVGIDFGFNAWGEKFHPYADDAAYAERILDHLGEERAVAPLILEGGSIAVDGAGTLLTTEQCLLHPSRNPSLAREEIEALLVEWLGVERVVWLGQGLVEDEDTDGHVDNCAAFLGPDRVLIQTVADEANPNWPAARENVERARAAGLEGRRAPVSAVRRARRPADRRALHELLPVQRGRHRPGGRSGDGRRGARAAGLAVARPRGGAGARDHARPRRRRGALHHPAGPGASRALTGGDRTIASGER